MILNTITHTDDKTRRFIEDYADEFAALGVIASEDYQSLQEHMAQAEEANVTVAGIEARRADAIATSAATIAHGDVTSEKLTAAATKLAADKDVHDLALAVWRLHVAAAKAIVLDGVRSIPEVLTDALARVAADGIAAADALTGITNAEEAIAASRVGEWSALRSAAAEYAAIDRLVSALRADNLLAGPKPTDTDRWAFRFRRPPNKVVRGGFRQTPSSDTEKRTVLVEELRSEPYVPASRDEVQAVIAAHRAGELVFA
ncbi:hypothetical protein GCM10009722_34640 [Williamsia deligens]|nr:hypothetical protein [Williamsia deligens]